MTDLWNYLKKTDKPIVLYGTGNGADKVLDRLLSMGVRPVGIFASNGFVRGQSFRGYRVESFETLQKRLNDMMILSCFGSNREDVLKNLAELSEKYELYRPDVPLYGETFFDAAFAKAHREELSCVRELLADQLSVKTFDNIISFKCSGDPKYLQDCEQTGDDMALLSFSEREVYLDLGAYRGDTVMQFLRHAPNPEKIFAVEPDPKTYQKLVMAVGELAECVHAAVLDKSGQIRFSADKGRGSAMGKGVLCPAVHVDGLLAGGRASFIKIDIEGAEAAALSGARKTIKAYRPKMMIAAYHRAEDLFSLPLYVHSLCPTYKIFFRHFRHSLAWDSYFYFL